MMNKNILIAGVGGQGAIFASRLLAEYAIAHNIFVNTCETIGMAQRGGSVLSHVRLGKTVPPVSNEENPIFADRRKYKRIYRPENIISPLIYPGSANVILAFEPLEALRYVHYLSEGGRIISSSVPIHSNNVDYDAENVYRALKLYDAVLVDTREIASFLVNTKVVNVIMLGALIGSKILNISFEDMETVILDNVAAKYIDVNLRALKAGFSAVSPIK